MTSWQIVSEVLKKMQIQAQPGVRLSELDRLAEDYIIEQGGRPYNKGYMGKDTWPENGKPVKEFPFTLVVNVNSVIAHGFPSPYQLKPGDIVSFDVGVEKDGLCGDAAFTMGVPPVSNKNVRLLYYAKRTLYEGIKKVKAGANTRDIARAMEIYVINRGFVMNETFASHYIGKEMHGDAIPNFTFPDYPNSVLKDGDMICLEPIITYEDRFGQKAGDWAFVTRDGRNSAMFEHQLLVTKDGCQVLTDHFTDDYEGRTSGNFH